MTDAARVPKLLPWLVIMATAVALTVPCILSDVRMNDSFWIDWVWLDQFAEQLRQGVLYPRWLPISHDGLGSPVFYYYPPVAFYLGSAFVLAGLSTYAGILATFFVAFILSGVAMYVWLRDQAPAPGPLVGAVIYMVAPYHAFNFYIRGAVAESVATAVLPLVMLGLRRLLQKGRGGFVLVAVSYAALICSHLPLALLASIFLIGPYALIESKGDIRSLLPLGAALGTGIALAAIYLVPALALEPYRDTAKLWHQSVLQPQSWTFWNSEYWHSQVYRAMLLIAAALAIPSVALVRRDRSRWALFGLACALIAIGGVPVIWALPLLKSVQFPFRLFPVAEFALATGAALVPWRNFPLTVVALPLLGITGFVATADTVADVPYREAQARHPDVPENLPPGERRYDWPSRWALDVAAAHRTPTFANGVTVEPVFYFPAWQVTCNGERVRTFPAPGTTLLAYPGRNCTRRLGWTGAERIGAIVSCLALLLLVALTARDRLLRRTLRRKDAAQEVTP